MPWFLLAAVVVINILKGGSILAIKLGLSGLPPILGAGIRFTAAGLLVGAWAAVRASKETHGQEHPRPVQANLFPAGQVGQLAASAALMTAAYALFYTALTFHHVSRAALFVNLNPFHVALFAHFALGERMSGRQTAGLVLAFCGVALIEYRTLRHGLRTPLAVGDLLFLSSGVLWAAQAVLKKRLTRTVAVSVITAWEVLPMGLFLLAAGSVHEGWSAVNWNAHAVGSLVYLALFGTVVAFLGFNWVLRGTDVSRVAPFSFVIPMTAFCLGILVLEEPFEPWLALAIAAVVAGLYATTTAGRPKGSGPAREPAEPEDLNQQAVK